MIPNKIYYYLGYNNLALMTDQERKHWLLKTDRKKWSQDKITGDVYQGQIENLGSDVILETEKLKEVYDTATGYTWKNSNADYIFSISPSAFTYSAAVNGFMFARVESVNYPTIIRQPDGIADDFHHYKIRFINCETCLIPFGGSNETSDVFAGRWIKTSTPPILMLLDDDGGYASNVSIPFDSTITNAEYYYPLNDILQPVPITETSTGTYVTDGFTRDEYIGLPAFWFTCDKSNIGPTISIGNNTSAMGKQLMLIGNAGNASKYRCKLFVDVDGHLDATPDDSSTSTCYVTCNCETDYVFHGDVTDFNVPIKPSSIKMGDQVLNITTSSDDTTITMTNTYGWNLVDQHTYRVRVAVFDQNCLDLFTNPLQSIFDVHLDESIAFANITTDTGYAGIHMSSSNDHSDIYPKYPHELNEWDGLPEWLQDPSTYSPEHMAIYAVHNTPTYAPGMPETRQTAALLLDPGKSKNTRDPMIIESYNRTHPYITFMDENPMTESERRQFITMIEDEESLITNTIYFGRVADTFFETFNMSWGNIQTEPKYYTVDYIWETKSLDEIDDIELTTYPDWVHSYGAELVNTMAVKYITDDYIHDPTEVFENDERGRIYVLSNDSTAYVNNNATAYPKPARTLARICDIPTSAMQLNGVAGLSPTQVVDPKYVRQQASYDLDDKNRLYNTMASRWVRPNTLDAYGARIQSDNTFVFQSEDALNRVDLINHNDFRELLNLVPEVDPSTVSVASIYDGGTRYAIDDIGVIMVGGYAFTYQVTEVDVIGSVTGVSITPTKDVTVHLANFDMTDGGEGITEPYGTSPTRGSGTGLKLRLRIADYESLKVTKGQIFNDLFALVKNADGVWIYTYDIPSTGVGVRTGTWNQSTLLSQFEDSVYGENGALSSAETMMVSMLPQRRELPVCKYAKNHDPTSVDTLVTSTFVNIIDTTKAPLPLANSTTTVDMTKFYCNGILKLSADARTSEAVLEKMKSVGLLRDNTYVFWKWSSTSGTNFEGGCIYQSFNNYRSTDQSTLLPKNDLEYPKYVNTNANTTIVWDVRGVGVMMWIYNPMYDKSEHYTLDPDTHDLNIDRVVNSWDAIEIRNPTSSQAVSLFDSSKLCKYNIWTNHPKYSSQKTNDSVYAQNVFVEIITVGTSIATANHDTPLVGNWQLVFPRVHSFRFSNDKNNVSYTPTQMQVIRGSSIDTGEGIVDEVTGYRADMKTLLISDTQGGSKLKVFNPNTSTWEII